MNFSIIAINCERRVDNSYYHVSVRYSVDSQVSTIEFLSVNPPMTTGQNGRRDLSNESLQHIRNHFIGVMNAKIDLALTNALNPPRLFNINIVQNGTAGGITWNGVYRSGQVLTPDQARYGARYSQDSHYYSDEFAFRESQVSQNPLVLDATTIEEEVIIPKRIEDKLAKPRLEI